MAAFEQSELGHLDVDKIQQLSIMSDVNDTLVDVLLEMRDNTKELRIKNLIAISDSENFLQVERSEARKQVRKYLKLNV